MKKFIVITFAAASLAACNDNSGTNTAVTSDTATTTTATSTTSTMDTNSAAVAPTTDTAITRTSNTTSKTAYTPAEGDVTYRNKKVQVRRSSAWVDTDKDVKLDNDVVVYRSGHVKKAGKEIDLKEGEVVNKTGNFFDKAGNAIDNVWDDTKTGVKKAGKAIGHALDKATDKIDSAANKDLHKH